MPATEAGGREGAEEQQDEKWEGYLGQLCQKMFPGEEWYPLYDRNSIMCNFITVYLTMNSLWEFIFKNMARSWSNCTVGEDLVFHAAELGLI